MPVQRSLAINYTNDEKIYQGNAVNEYLFGPSLLVIPYVTTQATVPAYLPAGDWYDLYNNKKYSGSNEYYYSAPVEKLPVFVRAGSIIPMQSLIQTTADKPTDTLTIHVYNGTEKNPFRYYEDAGDGYDYHDGGYYERTMTFDPSSKQLVLEKAEGRFTSHFTSLRLVFHGFDAMNSVSVNGTQAPLSHQEISFIAALSKLDQPGSNGAQPASQLTVVMIKNSNEKIIVSW